MKRFAVMFLAGWGLGDLLGKAIIYLDHAIKAVQ